MPFNVDSTNRRDGMAVNTNGAIHIINLDPTRSVPTTAVGVLGGSSQVPFGKKFAPDGAVYVRFFQ